MEGTPGESRKRPGCSLAVTLLHTTDLRHVPLILTYGLFSAAAAGVHGICPRAHVASGGERSLERLRIASRLPSGRSLSILRQSKNSMAVSQGRTQDKCAVP